MLPNSTIIEDAVLGENGLTMGFVKGSLFIDMSSAIPSSTRMIAKELKKIGVEMLDAPVSGGPHGAETGTLSIMVGGNEEVYNNNKFIFDIMGKNIIYMGGHGAGHITKAVNNALYATTLVAACESILLGTAEGIDPAKLIDAIGNSSGQCYASNKFKNYTLKRNFEPGFALDLLAKDVDIAMSMSHDIQLPMVTCHAARELLLAGQKRGMGKNDNTRVIELLEELINVQVVPFDK